jgi:hypothetical protein
MRASKNQMIFFRKIHKRVEPGTFPGLNNMDMECISEAMLHAMNSKSFGMTSGRTGKSLKKRSGSAWAWTDELNNYVNEKFWDDDE